MAASSGEPGPPPPGAWDRVPDDASALEADRLAWLAEQRALRRRRRLRRLVLTRRWERFGLSGPLVTACLAATTAVGALTVAMVPPSGPQRAAAAPLAAVPEASAAPSPPPPAVERPGGTVVGRRLPAVPLDGDATAISSADLRPAVLALVPARCDCAELIASVYQQAREFRLDLWLIGQAGSADGLIRLDEDGARGGARWAEDGAGRLASSLAARGVTLVTVRADGVVADLGRDLPLDPAALPALEPLFARLPTSNR